MTAVTVNVRLDWRAPEHYDRRRALPCRICKSPTHMRDATGAPCDKVCAEQELAAEILGAAGRRFADERFFSPTSPAASTEVIDG